MIWFFLFCVLFVVVFAVSPYFRLVTSNIFSCIYYAVVDIYHYFHDRRWNECECGFIDCYCGLFGQGKTLSATHRLISDYNRYNGKLLRIDGKLQRVEIRLFSNVELKGVPYIPFTSMQQLVDWQKLAQLPENHHITAIFLCDEASSVLNSRSFKDNFSYWTINSLLTCRHSRMGLVLTSQRFGQIDKLCRDVCQKVFQCSKVWRLLVQNVYDAYELENIANPLNVKPKGALAKFCSDKYYGHYDTLALVDSISKSAVSGDMRSDDEIRESVASDSLLYALPDRRLKKDFRQNSRSKKVS